MSTALNFAACQKDLQETQDPSRKSGGAVNFELFASVAGVKTANDGLATNWTAEDRMNVFHSSDEGIVSDGEFTLADAATGRFTGTVSGELSGESCSWYAVYPYSAASESPAAVSVTLGGKTQTQDGNSATTHLCGAALPLYGVAADVSTGERVSLTMANLCAVARVTVKNKSGAPITVADVALTAPEAIVGDFSVDITGAASSYTASTDASSTVTLNVNGGETIANGASADFYIALKPFNTAASSLTLSVNGYRKTSASANTVTFTAGAFKTLVFEFDKTITTPESLGFTDVSSDFVTSDQSFIKVYLADAITDLPISILSTKWDGNWTNAASSAWVLYGLQNHVYNWEILKGDWEYGDDN